MFFLISDRLFYLISLNMYRRWSGNFTTLIMGSSDRKAVHTNWLHYILINMCHRLTSHAYVWIHIVTFFVVTCLLIHMHTHIHKQSCSWYSEAKFWNAFSYFWILSNKGFWIICILKTDKFRTWEICIYL